MKSPRGRAAGVALGLVLALGLTTGCGSSAGIVPTQGVDDLVVPSPSPRAADFVEPNQGRNDWFPLAAGARWRFESAATPATLEVTVESRTTEVAGIDTWQVRTDLSGVAAPGTSTHLVATDSHDNLWLLGESAEDPDRSWRTGGDVGAGLLWPDTPRVGDAWRRAQVPAVVEDVSEIVRRDQDVVTPAGTFHDVLVSRTSDKLHPLGTRQVIWARGTGPVEVRLGAGEVLSLTSHAAGS